MIYSERTKHNAFLLDETGKAEKLARVPYYDDGYNERWLQELLAENPSLIPSAEISIEYADLVCVGREVPVGSDKNQGFIDNLYVSPSGAIVIVETKLFRNSEAKRAVIAQIIEYAKEIQKWTSEQIEKVAADYFYKKEKQSFRLIDIMAKKGFLAYSDEAALTDKINQNLKTANFLLMIIGDGIKSGVEQIADFLNENAFLSLQLALAEIEIYRYDGKTILIPYLLNKTVVIEKTKYVYYDTVSLAEEESPTKKSTYTPKPILPKRDFIQKFAENGGFDEDSVFEFIQNLEAIDGISTELCPTELHVCFDSFPASAKVLLTFSISEKHADVWLQPSAVYKGLANINVSRQPCDDFLAFYKDFIDVAKCKTKPYENDRGFYRANIDDMLDHADDFLSACEEFANSVCRERQ